MAWGNVCPLGEYLVLQYVREVQGHPVQEGGVCHHRCVRRFLPWKLVEPLDVLNPVWVTISDSRNAAVIKIVTKEDGQQLRTGVGATATYKYITPGEVSWTRLTWPA